MMNSTSSSFVSSKILFLFLGVAVLALAPEAVFAQHVGGHMGGGGGGGARPSGGGGGGHFSPPPAPRAPSAPAPRPAAAPAPHFNPPVAATPPHVPVYHQPAGNPPVNNAVVHPAPIVARGANGQLPPAGFRGMPLGTVVGSSAAQGNPQGNSALPGNAAGVPSRRFFGDGHQIWTEPARTGTSSATTGSSVTSGRVFNGPAGFMPGGVGLVGPNHFYPPGHFHGPIIIGPGFGFGYGYGSPFYGSAFGFGSGFFFGNPFIGFQYGSVWVPCNGFGPGLQCAPFNYYYNNGYDSSYDSSYNSVISGGPEPYTETQSQEIYSPYSPGLPPAEENSSGSSANEYLLYLKDGAVYMVSDYWFADGKLVYSTSSGQESVDLDRIDMQKTLDVNAKRGLVFTLRPEPPQSPVSPQNDQNAPAQPAPQP